MALAINRVSRWLTIFMSLVCFPILAQEVVLNKLTWSSQELMDTVSEQTGFHFSYQGGILHQDKPINLSSTKLSIDQLLNQMLANQDIQWKIRKNLIILNETSTSTNRVSRITLNGYVKDINSGESLLGVHITDRRTGKGVVSNEYGFYSMQVPAKESTLQFSYLGYQSKDLRLNVQQDTTINIYLVPIVNELEEVLISGEVPYHEQIQMGSISLKKTDIKALPMLLGEVDVLKAIQLLPGIQGGVEGSSAIYVRGGGPDQNLLLLDGVPVYNAFHLFGFFSVFNADAIQSVDVIKGGFPARYGGRLSSIIDMRMKEGNTSKFHGEGSIGNVSAKFLVEGPLGKTKKSSYMLSARRTYLDALIVPFAKLAETDRIVSYHFWDVNAKVNHTISDKDKVFLSVYTGKDRFKDQFSRSVNFTNFREETDELGALNWGNLTTAFRWNHIYSPRLFGNMTLTFSDYQFNLLSQNEYVFDIAGDVDSVFQRNDYRSSIQDWAVKLDFDYSPRNEHRVRFGLSAITHLFKPGVSRYQSQIATDTILGSADIRTSEFYAYIEDEWRISSKVGLNAGLHYSGSWAENSFYSAIQPRLAFNYLINDQNSVKLSYTKMAQYIHLLVNSGVGLPTDLWVPVTDKVKPQLSDQIAIGIASRIHPSIELSVESYYKWMDNLIEYRDGAGFLDIDNSWDEKIEIGKGYSYGLEVFLQKTKGRTKGSLGYTWSRSFRQFDNLNFGERFPYRYDRPHDINLTLSHQLNDHINLSAVWVFGTGYPITLPASQFAGSDGHVTGNTESPILINYPGRNSSRVRDYHRLDLSLSTSKKKKWGERKWVFGLYNVYSRLNPIFVDLKDEVGSTKEFVQLSLFPIIPSISYQFKF